MPSDSYTDDNMRKLSERTHRCETCVFFDLDIATPQPNDGQCQIRSPFVDTKLDDWCGDYHPRKPVI